MMGNTPLTIPTNLMLYILPFFTYTILFPVIYSLLAVLPIELFLIQTILIVGIVNRKPNPLLLNPLPPLCT
jgi:hypothetical protein